MITLDPDTPEHVVIATASGSVTADDYEQSLIPAVDQALGTDSRARLLFILSDVFSGYEAGAARDDASFGMHHWGDFARIGLVSDRESWRVAFKAMGFLMPGEARVFALADEAEAREWITS